MQPTYLSWTQEDTFLRCGVRYAFRYGEKISRPLGVWGVRGIAAHRAAERDLRAKMDDGALLPGEEVEQVAADEIDRAFRGEVWLDPDLVELGLGRAKSQARDSARSLARLHHQTLAPHLEPTAVEIKVEARFPNDLPVPYVGVIDLVDRGQDVVDLKTKRKAPARDLAAESGQLTRYAGLFYAANGRLPRSLGFDIVWTTEKRREAKSFHPRTTRSFADLEVGFRRGRAMLQALEREVFLPTADPRTCAWCAYQDLCPYFAGRPRPTS